MLKIVTWVLLALLLAFPLYWRRVQAQMLKEFAPRNTELEEALGLLELEPSAGLEEIRRAHRLKIQQMHPDKGGNIFDASRINRARDILLRNVEEKQAA